MFKITSDLNLVLRREFSISGQDVSTSGYAGTWVTLNTDGTAKRTAVLGTGLAWPVFNEGNRDGSIGYTPDVTKTVRVTVLFGGPFAATTDQFSGTAPAVGDPLTTTALGKLTKATIGTHPIVAFCTAAPRDVVYFGSTYSCIDIWRP